MERAATRQPVIVRSRCSSVTIADSPREGLAIVTFSLADGACKHNGAERRIEGTDALSADELTALSKAFSAAARRVRRA